MEKPKVKNSEIKQQQMLVLGAVVGIVIAVIIGVVVFQLNTGTITGDYSGIEQSRTEDGAFILGSPDAPVTIVAFEDFLCPHCQSYQGVVHDFIDQYVKTGQARFEFRMLPTSSGNFPVAFQLAECSEELRAGSFWDAHDTLFNLASASRFSSSSARQFSEEMGFNYGELLTCTNSADQYTIDARYAQQFSQITGTPTVGWRGADGELRFEPLPAQPTVAQMGALVQTQSR